MSLNSATLFSVVGIACVVCATSGSPRLFAAENSYKNNAFGEFKSWRLVSVDLQSGHVTGVTSWNGGTIVNKGEEGRLIGASWEYDARSQLIVESGSIYSCYDVSKGKSCSDMTVPMSGNKYEEHSGFFLSANLDDVRPYNTIVSLYDNLILSDPKHFAVVNASYKGFYNLCFARNWAVNSADAIVYVAANGGLYRVQRITGEVKELAFSNSDQIHALFSPPEGVISSTESLLVLTCTYNQITCTLHEVDLDMGTTKVFTEIPGSMHLNDLNCKSYHESTNRLYLGCDPVVTVDLKARRVSSVTKIQTQYSIRGITVMDSSNSMLV